MYVYVYCVCVLFVFCYFFLHLLKCSRVYVGMKQPWGPIKPGFQQHKRSFSSCPKLPDRCLGRTPRLPQRVVFSVFMCVFVCYVNAVFCCVCLCKFVLCCVCLFMSVLVCLCVCFDSRLGRWIER